MNRHQFLAEFSQYLTFLSQEERKIIVTRYARKFDRVGQEGEAALLATLGTPMKTAIDLKRRREAGEDIMAIKPEDAAGPLFYDDEEKQAPAVQEKHAPVVQEKSKPVVQVKPKPVVQAKPEPAVQVKPEPAVQVKPQPVVQEEPQPIVPEESAPAVQEELEPIVQQKPDPAVHEKPAPTVQEEPSPVVLDTPTYEESENQDSRRSSSEPIVEQVYIDPSEFEEDDGELKDFVNTPPHTEDKLSGAALVFAVLGIIILGTIIATVALAFGSVGGFLIVSGGNFLVAGLSSFHRMPDALMLFGISLALIAVGLVVVWFALWVAIRLIGGLIRKVSLKAKGA